ncbi:MAG: alpha/beta hydrolase [Alphaproteobacteria bacterium]
MKGESDKGYLVPDQAALDRVEAEMAAERGLYKECYITSPDGLKLHYRDYAPTCDTPGTPVFCLPGLTRNSHDFHPLARALQSGRRVIAIDYCGRGKSARNQPPERIAPRRLIGDAIAVMQASHIGPCVAIGTSLGGFIACALAVIRPIAFKGLVMNDAGPEIGHEALERIKSAVAAPPNPTDWLDAVSHEHIRFDNMPLLSAEDWILLSMGSYEPVPDGPGLRPAYDLSLSTGTAGPPPEAEELWRLFLGTGYMPTLLIRGSESTFLREQTAQDMLSRHPRLTLTHADGFGHAPPIFYEPWATEIRDLLDRIDG